MEPILKKNFSYLFLIQNINYIVPLLLLPYLTRTLGASNFGRISFVQAVIAYFILLTDFGFNTSSTQEVVRTRHDRKALSKVFWTTTITKIFFALISLIVLTVVMMTVPRLTQIRPYLLVAFLSVLSTLLFPLWFFQGLEKMSHIAWFNAIPRILVLIATVWLVHQPTDDLLALLIQSVGTLCSSVICTLFLFNQRLVHFYKPTWREMRITIQNSWPIFASGVATNLYTTTNTVVLGLLGSDVAVGIFAASEKIIRAIIALFSSVSQVTFPRINSYYLESKEKALQFGGKLFRVTALATAAIGLTILFFAPLMVRLLFGTAQYAETIIILRLSSFIPFFAIGNGILAVNLLITFGLQKYLVRIVGAGGILSLLLIVPAVLTFQARGVAVVALATEVLISLMLWQVFRKHNLKLQIL